MERSEAFWWFIRGVKEGEKERGRQRNLKPNFSSQYLLTENRIGDLFDFYGFSNPRRPISIFESNSEHLKES